MRALLVPVREHPREVDVTDFRSMAALIGCETIQTTIIEDGIYGIYLVCDECFAIDNAKPNRTIDGIVYAGDLIVVGYDSNGDFASLPQDKIEKYKALFWEPEYLDGSFKITTSSKGNVVSIDQTFVPRSAPSNDDEGTNEESKPSHNNKKLISQILNIRSTGLVNMLSLKEVQRLAYEKQFYDLVIFIEEHPQEYWHFIMTGEGLGDVEDVENE